MKTVDNRDILYVLGAGADVSLGLPTMAGLTKKLNLFAKGDGKAIHEALRSKVKGIRFNLDKLGADTAEQLAEVVLGADNSLVEGIKNSLRNVDTKAVPSVGAMLSVLDRLEQIRQANNLDEETANGLADFAGEPSDSASERLFNPRRLTFDSTPRQALLRACREALNDTKKLNESQREAVEALFAALATFEDLLGALFLGFFNNDKTLQKKYFYLAWLFWSYIYYRENEGANRFDGSCYSMLDEIGACNAVTFNYTGFLRRVATCEPTYFHGDGANLMSFHNREILSVAGAIKGSAPIAAIARYIEQDLWVDWNQRVSEVTLPAIVPPLIMKPLISSEYVDAWYSAARSISDAKCIVVIGYSFSYADEHFNDLLRKRAAQKPIVVFDPAFFEVAANVCRVTGRIFDSLEPAYHSGLSCLAGQNMVVAEAFAQNISTKNIEDLIGVAMR